MLSNSRKNNALQKVVSFVFYYRTFLIVIGLAGLLLTIVQKGENVEYAIVILSFFILVYGILCIGPTTQMRNIEMRYFLQVDVLLILYSGQPLLSIYNFFKNLHS